MSKGNRISNPNRWAIGLLVLTWAAALWFFVLGFVMVIPALILWAAGGLVWAAILTVIVVRDVKRERSI